MKKSLGLAEKAFLLFSLSVILILGCADNGRDVQPVDLENESEFFAESASAASTGSLKLKGYVMKGPVGHSTVNFYSLKSNGARGKKLATKTTDDLYCPGCRPQPVVGYFSVKLSPAPTTPVLIEAKGGSYVDEVSGNTVTMTTSNTLSAIALKGETFVIVSPLTHWAATRARNLARTGGKLTTAVKSSYLGVAQQYNLSDISPCIPVPPYDEEKIKTAELKRRIYGLTLAGLSQLAQTLNVLPADLTAALAEDVKDGVLDGKNGDLVVTVPLIGGGTIDLPPTTGTLDLHNAIDDFIDSARNKTGISDWDTNNNPASIGVPRGFYITTTALPFWTSGIYGTYTITGKGGAQPYSCSLKSGSVPAGFLLTAGCEIAGSYTLEAGTSMKIFPSFIITMTDSSAPAQSQDLEVRIIVIKQGPAISISSPLECYQSPYSCNLQVATASGGTPPYFFELKSMSGFPPPGTILDINGNLTGSASVAGKYTFGVCVVDLVGLMNCGTATVTVKPSKYKLTVKKTGDGAGTVTSNPKGINCGSDCSQVYDMNVTVILSAKPAAGSNFIKWSGDCSGMGNCTLDMNRARKVTVEFSTTCPSGYRDCGKFCCLSNQYCCSTGPACCPASKFLYCDKSNKCFAQITDPENTCGFWDYEVCEPPY